MANESWMIPVREEKKRLGPVGACGGLTSCRGGRLADRVPRYASDGSGSRIGSRAGFHSATPRGRQVR